jgi:hypothetical protein
MSLKKVNTKIEIETTAEWLNRMAVECANEMPLLKTSKMVNGKRIVKTINWNSRIKGIHKKGGKAAVRKYLVEAVQDYNLKITKIKKK